MICYKEIRLCVETIKAAVRGLMPSFSVILTAVLFLWKRLFSNELKRVFFTNWRPFHNDSGTAVASQ